MIQKVIALFVGSLFACLVGCKTDSLPRVVRLKLHPDGTRWICSVNRSAQTNTTWQSLTNALDGLQLHHGDVILLGTSAEQIPTLPPEIWARLSCYSNTNRVAVYCSSESDTVDIFSTPVYHWVAPFENPRGLGHASFFVDGEFVGRGLEGYQILLNRIEHAHANRIYVLGSLYDGSGGFGPNEVPFENEAAALDSVAKKAGTRLLFLHALPN